MARHRKFSVARPNRTVVKALVGSALGGVMLGVLWPLGPLVLWMVGL